MEPSPGQLVKLYTDMVRSRAFEEMAISQVYAGKVPSSWMSGIGQEGIVGAVGQLRPDDYITYTHRGAYCLICRGLDPGELLAELFGKRTGCCKGKGGRHIADVAHGVFGKSGTIGGHAPLAVGLATAAQIRGGDQVVMSFFGDGASSRGTTHECMNMAALWKLPIVWVCENNGYAGLSPNSTTAAMSNIADIAASYRMPGVTWTATTCWRSSGAQQPIGRARAGGTRRSGLRLIACGIRRGAVEAASGRIELWKGRGPSRAFRRGSELGV
jgi:pyruvate dehydrogenase E1 component alpha subunit